MNERRDERMDEGMPLGEMDKGKDVGRSNEWKNGSIDGEQDGWWMDG